jgi:hypothetical protein
MIRPSALLPKAIRVGAFDFAVEELKPMTAGALRRFGEFSAMENCIRVDPQADRIKVLDTLLHEIGHAIFWAYNIDDKDDEERTVGIQASAWTQIYRDNPDLLRFIGESVTPQSQGITGIP